MPEIGWHYGSQLLLHCLHRAFQLSNAFGHERLFLQLELRQLGKLHRRVRELELLCLESCGRKLLYQLIVSVPNRLVRRQFGVRLTKPLRHLCTKRRDSCGFKLLFHFQRAGHERVLYANLRLQLRHGRFPH